MKDFLFKRPSTCEKLKEVLRDRVLSGEFPPASLFPSQNELSTAYGVGHNTVREAIGVLVNEGFLIRIQGKGTFVVDKLPRQTLRNACCVGLALTGTSGMDYPGVVYSVQSLTNECNARSADLKIFTCPSSKIKGSGSHLENVIATGELSGLLVDFLPYAEDISMLQDMDIPFVIVGSSVPDRKVSCVSIDVEKGAEMACKHLLNLGHEKILMLLGPEDDRGTMNEQLCKGYQNALPARNRSNIIHSAWGADNGKKYAEKFLRSADRPTAVICAEEFQALGFMWKAVELGYSIPDDISVMGWSDRLCSSAYPVPLTTVDTCLREQDMNSVDILLKLIADKGNARQLKITPRLLIRNSTDILSQKERQAL